MGLPCCKRDFRVLLRLTLVNLFFFFFKQIWNETTASVRPCHWILSCRVPWRPVLIWLDASPRQHNEERADSKRRLEKNKNKTKNPLRKKNRMLRAPALNPFPFLFFDQISPPYLTVCYYFAGLDTFTEFYRVLLDFTGFFWVFLDFTGFNCLLWSFKVPLPF